MRFSWIETSALSIELKGIFHTGETQPYADADSDGRTRRFHGTAAPALLPRSRRGAPLRPRRGDAPHGPAAAVPADPAARGGAGHAAVRADHPPRGPHGGGEAPGRARDADPRRRRLDGHRRRRGRSRCRRRPPHRLLRHVHLQAHAGARPARPTPAAERPPLASPAARLDEFEQTQLVVALPTDHPLAHERGPLAASALSGEDLVSYPRGSAVASVAAEISRQAGFRPRIVQEATETSTLIALVAAGLGLCVLPASSALPLSTATAIRPLDPAVTIGLATGWRADDASPLVAAFIDLVRDAAAALRPEARRPTDHRPTLS